MSIRDLVPKFGKSQERTPARRREDDPFHDLQRQMNRLFDDFLGSFDLAPRWGWDERETTPTLFTPRVDVAETAKEVKVSAELPGMDEKDITVELDDTALTIRGEKKAEQEDKGKNWYRREQSWGTFHRVVPLPAAVHGEKAKARFRKGVLTVTAPKRQADRPGRKAVTIETD